MRGVRRISAALYAGAKARHLPPMKFLFTLLPALFLACVAWGVNSLEQAFLCPICGTRWEQRIESSGRSLGLRLDLRQIGDVVDPPTLPQCPKCRFPLFSDRLHAQANDPAKAQAFKRLRSFVTGGDFQMLAAKNPSYFTLAQVQQHLEAPHRHIALSYLRASWQVEDRETACRRLLEKALTHYMAALDGMEADAPPYGDLALLCGEVERRLGKWEDAENRFRVLEASGRLKGTPQAAIPAMQFRLIERRDSAPHTLEGPEIVERQPRPDPGVKVENPAAMSLASGRAEKPDSLKLEAPPKAPEELLPAVLFEAPTPVPSIKLDSAPVEKPDAVLKLGSLPNDAMRLPPVAPIPLPEPPVKTDAGPVDKPDVAVKPVSPPKVPEEIPPAAPPQPPIAPLKPDAAPIEKPDGVAKPAAPTKTPEQLPPAAPAAPAKAPVPPVKPDSNFSDNPD
jgi:hypothetical protein